MNATSTSTGTGRTPATIFVVDDEPLVLELALAALQPRGFKVRTFLDPNQALQEFPAVCPAVVVTDYAMGRMNGLDLARECRRLNPRQKILLLSATVDEAIYRDAAVKPDRFLAKPFQIGDFVELVERLAEP
ncbi:MAG TPA: response regulator [Verrucomicrobiae bacterium]|nr:response regulator [Verrucomicrobiae bacterium]